MKCKYCKNEIPDNSIFCMWCGERLVKERKKKDEIKVPKPRQLKSGKWNIQLRAEGESVTEDTAELCELKAKAIRAEFVQREKDKPKVETTLEDAIDKYIASKSNVLSPSTIVGYKSLKKNRFKSVMKLPLSSVTNWQAVVNTESANVSPKTIKNAWGLVRPVLKNEGITPPEVKLPSLTKKPPVFLTAEQIKVFVKAVKGTKVEIPALLGLHSLRRSEMAALDWSNVDLKNKRITVSGAVVPGENWTLVEKPQNKTASSQRTIPIMIPELYDALKAVKDKNGKVVTCYASTVYDWVNEICEQNNLPKLGVHGLRHSFASLAYHIGMDEQSAMQIGGWSDYATMRKIYTHLSSLDLSKAENKMSDFYGFTNDFTNAEK